jgi:cyclase
MLEIRLIPCLLLREESLVKSVRFKKFQYIGDPINTVRIFNELEVDELIILDTFAGVNRIAPNFPLLKDIVNECFMPMSYGGGISNLEEVKLLFKIGFEKIVLNSQPFYNPNLISQIASIYGNQSIIASIDYKKNFFGKEEVYINGGTYNINVNPIKWAKKLENMGAGEIFLTCIDREGTWSGFDSDTIKKVSQAVNIPVIAHGGCGNLNDIKEVVNNSSADAVAVGSMVVFQKKNMGVLVSFPDRNSIQNLFEKK